MKSQKFGNQEPSRGEDWLVKSNMAKTKLIKYHHQNQTSNHLPTSSRQQPIMMVEPSRKEALGRLLKHKLTLEIHIRSISEDAGKKGLVTGQ